MLAVPAMYSLPSHTSSPTTPPVTPQVHSETTSKQTSAGTGQQKSLDLATFFRRHARSDRTRPFGTLNNIGNPD